MSRRAKMGKAQRRKLHNKRAMSKTLNVVVHRIRADIQAARRAAEPFIVFEGPITSFSIASYASAKDVAERLMKICNHAERLCNERDQTPTKKFPNERKKT